MNSKKETSKSYSMVTINSVSGNPRPHNLRCKKSAPTFKNGETQQCYITKYDNGRYAVFSAQFKSPTYHVFDSAEELHEHFDEL